MGKNNKQLATNNYIERMESWVYDESVKSMQKTVYKWKNLTVDIVEELYLARNILSAQGKRTDCLEENKSNFGKFFPKLQSHTWEEYCQSIGISKRTANLWLERFLPEEQQLLDPEEHLARKKILAKKKEDFHQELIHQYEASGVKGEEWDKYTDKLYQLHQVAKGKMINPSKLPRDYFQNLPQTKVPDPTTLSNTDVLAYHECLHRNREYLYPEIVERDQVWMFYRLEEFINRFPTREAKAMLIGNLVKKLADLRDEITIEQPLREKESK